MSKCSVEHTLKLWRDTGEVMVPGPGRSAKQRKVMEPHEIEYLLELTRRYPDLYLDKLQAQLQLTHGVIVGISTIWDTLTELGLSHKKLSKAAAECNAAARTRWQFVIGDETPDCLVFVDESCVNCHTTYRMYGWADRGKCTTSHARFIRGQGYLLLPALSLNGIIHLEICKGSYNGKEFARYVEELMPYMSPWPAPCSVLVMDNCTIHRHPDVKVVCDAHGVRLCFLPPYSPDYNPIEEAFSFIKSILRHYGNEFHLALDSKDFREVEYVLLNVLACITPKKAHGWFHDSGYI